MKYLADFSRKIAILIILLLITPLAIHAQDKEFAPAENKGAKSDDKGSGKKKGWFPYMKNKKWYPFVGQTGAKSGAEGATPSSMQPAAQQLPSGGQSQQGKTSPF